VSGVEDFFGKLEGVLHKIIEQLPVHVDVKAGLKDAATSAVNPPKPPEGESSDATE
jgi:hypothetical protein